MQAQEAQALLTTKIPRPIFSKGQATFTCDAFIFGLIVDQGTGDPSKALNCRACNRVQGRDMSIDPTRVDTLALYLFVPTASTEPVEPDKQHQCDQLRQELIQIATHHPDLFRQYFHLQP